MNLPEYFPMWDKLSPAQQETLRASAQKRSFRKGELLHNGSADCAGLFLVEHGQLRAFILSEEGREITLYRLFERDICLFSASCMMSSIQFDISIQAEKDSEAWLIPTDVYKGLMGESAPLANYTNELMGSRFSEVMWRMDQVMWKSFDKRLAAFLLEEAGLEETRELRITHETIAKHLGSAREVVTRMLRYFQEEGFVTLRRGVVEIEDEKGLAALSE